jgi:hypothetical protein
MDNVRPPSLLGHWKTKKREQLEEAATRAKPRAYFRASELGAECRRQVMYDALGFTPRSEALEGKLTMEAGEVYHALIQNTWTDTYQLDGVEGVFEDNQLLWNHLLARAEELGATVELKEFPIPDQVDPVTGAPKVIRTLEYKLEAADDFGSLPVTLRVRPDGVLVGLAGQPGYWEPEEWTLLEIKSTTDWGVKEAKKKCEWYPSYIIQSQISMHLLGLQETLLLQIGRDKCLLLGDDYQKAYRNSRWPDATVPEYQWQRLVYRPELAGQLMRRLAIWERQRLHLQGIADKHGLDSEEMAEALRGDGLKFGCEGRGDWVYNRCRHSQVRSGSGGPSQAQCPGGC